MIKDMADAPRDGTHFLALEQVGIDGTSDSVLEWREIWFEPANRMFPTMWKSEGGEASFGADCFVGWVDLPPKRL